MEDELLNHLSDAITFPNATLRLKCLILSSLMRAQNLRILHVNLYKWSGVRTSTASRGLWQGYWILLWYLSYSVMTHQKQADKQADN